jgi:uncharacterized protein YkwD
MSSSPAAVPASAPTAVPAVAPAVAGRAVEARRRLVLLLVALAVALTAVVLPQGESPAHAATAKRITAATTASFARSMLALLNRERRANHRRPLTMSTRLKLSAHRHDTRMARTNTMSHQLPGEAFFATRISRTGYRWRAAGENIGWNSNLSRNGVLALERSMYNEKAPNNGHRVNILSTSFTQVGIDVYYDAKHHKVWFTQDFGAPIR